MRGFEEEVRDWPTVAAVARDLGLSRNSIYRLVAAGRLIPHRMGPRGGKIQFDPADIRAYVDGTRAVPRIETVARRPLRLRGKYDHGY